MQITINPEIFPYPFIIHIYFFFCLSLTGWTQSSTGSVRMMLHAFATLMAGMRRMNLCPLAQSFPACTAMLTAPRSRADG